MFSLFKKKVAVVTQELLSPVTGEVLHLEAVADPMFSEKMMGDGFAVYPKSDEIYAPVSGKIVSIFPSKHAIGLITSQGIEVLIHIGIDTVELKGVPFDIKVNENEEITAGSLLAIIDLTYLAEVEKDPTVMVIITNMTDIESLDGFDDGQVIAKEKVLNYQLK
ncbi:PTS sugar transporter subunit IIA [Vagococcus salmoninarum]|uniref:PTS sugar transporter subunit IIA n=1 Tax=Vagococcus salmoninarum TaxID=2739 RepID=UPI0028D0CF92|nr:PTS glucose transporter subunit IIA [Vagococcus salmoninarum]